jgi:hypothetical protein
MKTSVVPAGLEIVFHDEPGVKTPGYCQMFLRNNQTSPVNYCGGMVEFHFHKYRSSYSMRCFFSSAKNSS